MTEAVNRFGELIEGTDHSAVHLELRDAYTPDDPVFLDWQAGRLPLNKPAYPDWLEQVREHTARGVEFRRARVVSEPVTDFVRFEYEITDALNVAAGEQVRWLPRRRASDLLLPGNDLWIFDGRVIRFGYFAGNGDYLGDDITDDPVVVEMCVSAFEVIWKRAVPHADYTAPYRSPR
jgi:hypothetical protein